MSVQIFSIAIVVLGAVAAVRKVDIRIVLGSCALVIFLLAGKPIGFFVTFAAQMSNLNTVVPICSAMGFAFVVRMTRCDRHLIHLLTTPLRWVRSLTIPGGVAVPFVVNTAIVSQSSTSATVGPVLVPLALTAGVSLGTAASMLLLGSSVGGELFNPGAVEIVTLSGLLSTDATATVARLMTANLLASGVALVTFWLLALRLERSLAGPGASTAALAKLPSFGKSYDDEPDDADAPFRLNIAMALVPIVPLAILFAVVNVENKPKELTETILIGAAMIVGTVVAGLVVFRKSGDLLHAFFDGAGYAFTHVISLIVTAVLFTESIKAVGLIESLAAGLAGRPVLLIAGAAILPFVLAVVTGSGIAPAVAVMQILVPLAEPMGVDPGTVGALCAVSAQLGRTASPAAAVVMMTSAVTGEPPARLIRRVAQPLVVALVVLLIVALAGGI